MKRIEKLWNESKRDPELKGAAICNMIECDECVCKKTCERLLTKEEVQTKYETLKNWADEELDADHAAVPASDYAIQRIDELKMENDKLRSMFWAMVSLRYEAKQKSLDNLIQFSLFTDPDKFEKIMAERDRYARYSARAKQKSKRIK